MKVQQLIDEQLDVKRDRPFSGLYNPSLLGQCKRRQYYSITREEQSNPPDSRTLRVFHCGNIFHDFIQNIIKEQGYDVEVEYKDKINGVSLRADAVNSEEVVEIKSMHSRGFWYMKKSLETSHIYDIKPEHVKQGVMSAIYLERPLVRLIYVSKDDLCIAEFLIKVTDEMIKEVDEEKEIVLWHVDFKELPKAEPKLYVDKRTGKPKECTYCSYKDKCRGIEKEAKNEL